MEPAFIAACLGWGATAYFFTRLVRDINHGHRLQISGLLNRIQAPEAAVTQELTGAEEHETMILPHTAESYWHDVEHKAAA